MAFERRPEDELIHRLLTVPVRRGNEARFNILLDQQIALAGDEPEDPDSRIDLAYFDRNLGRVVFAEVKGIWDSRLLQLDPRPKVIDQLERYPPKYSADCHVDRLATPDR